MLRFVAVFPKTSTVFRHQPECENKRKKDKLIVTTVSLKVKKKNFVILVQELYSVSKKSNLGTIRLTIFAYQ